VNWRKSSFYQLVTRITSIGVNTIIFIAASRGSDISSFSEIAYFLSLIVVVSLLGSVGFQASLLQFPQRIKANVYRNAWTIDNFFVKFPSSVIMFLLAPFLSHQLATDIILIHALSVLLFISSLESYAYIYLTKNLLFFQRMKLELSRPVSTLLAYGCFLLGGFDQLYSVIFAYILGFFIRTITSHFICCCSIRPFLNLKLSRMLYRKGIFLFFSNQLKVLYENVDKIFFPVFFSIELFGIYALLFKLPSLAKTLALSVLHKVLYPMLRSKGVSGNKRSAIFNKLSQEILILSGMTIGLVLVDFYSLSLFIFGKNIDMGMEIVYLAGLAAFFRVMMMQLLIYMRSNGDLSKELKFISIGIISLVLFILFLNEYELVGILISLLLSDALVSVIAITKYRMKKLFPLIKTFIAVIISVGLLIVIVNFLPITSMYLKYFVFCFMYIALFKLNFFLNKP
jgi:O-antigen/teichoic acid export membrane protein